MVEPVRLAYLLTLSAPIKPGAVHRLVPDPLFEARLAEFVAIEKILDAAHERGEDLARGKIDARSMGIGRLIGEALRRSFEATELRPLTGLVAASIVVSAVLGYSSASRRLKPEDSARRIVSALYSSPGGDAAQFVSALEAVGDSELVLELDKRGLTPRRLELNDTSIGEVFEAASNVDLGFLFNVRGLPRLLDIVSKVRRAPNTLAGIVASYLALLRERGLAELRGKPDVRALRAIDERIRRSQGYVGDRLLGAVAAAAAIVLSESPLLLPQP